MLRFINLDRIMNHSLAKDDFVIYYKAHKMKRGILSLQLQTNYLKPTRLQLIISSWVFSIEDSATIS